MSEAQLEQLCCRFEKAVARLEKLNLTGVNAAGDADEAEVPEFISEYNDLVESTFKPWYELSSKIGGKVDEQAKAFKVLAEKHHEFLVLVSKHSKPTTAELPKILTPIGEQGQAVMKITDRKFMNQCKAVAEGGQAFSWMTYPKPWSYVDEIKNACQFYTNKVLVESRSMSKEDGDLHKEWTKALVQIFVGLRDYIKAHHKAEPSWNYKGTPAVATPKGVPPPPPPCAVPPPPPPPCAATSAPKPAAKPAPDMSALLSQLNQGSAVTKGLKKVTKDQMTHKNPELRKAHTAVPFKKNASTYKPVVARKPNQVAKKPPKKELEDGKKWVVEYQENANMVIDDTNMKQVVYVYKCTGSVLTVKGKVNSIIIDSCKKFGLVLDAVISGVEVVNSQSVKVQMQGQCPTISIDKTDGCLVYLHKDCMDCQVVTAKSSEMNISIPKEDGDFDEHPVVEQFRTHYDPVKKVLVTECSEICA